MRKWGCGWRARRARWVLGVVMRVSAGCWEDVRGVIVRVRRVNERVLVIWAGCGCVQVGYGAGVHADLEAYAARGGVREDVWMRVVEENGCVLARWWCVLARFVAGLPVDCFVCADVGVPGGFWRGGGALSLG